MKRQQETTMMQRERGMPDSEAAEEPTDLLGADATVDEDTLTPSEAQELRLGDEGPDILIDADEDALEVFDPDEDLEASDDDVAQDPVSGYAVRH
jgi:hypothetical protein